MLNLIDSLKQFEPNKNYVLVIILETHGSTYRKAGTLMLVDETNQYWGLISGGCLEGDIVAHCEDLFKQQEDKIIHYDMRGEDDLVWGMGLGCDGAVNLLLKYLPAKQQHWHFFDGLKWLSQGVNVDLTINTLKPFNLTVEPNLEKPKGLVQQRTAIQNNQLHIFLPAVLNVLICGASPDVHPVAQMAQLMGWKVTVIDHRREWLQQPKYFGEATVLQIKKSQWASFKIEQFNAAIIMSHQFERDQQYLAKILDSHIAYIGLLGPSKRRDQLLQACSAQFSNLKGRVFGPVGLDIGADTPETIALAIIAEIQAVRSKKTITSCYQDARR
ncbi:XdhC family protein [Aliikangiella sp. IMCC44653]